MSVYLNFELTTWACIIKMRCDCCEIS